MSSPANALMTRYGPQTLDIPFMEMLMKPLQAPHGSELGWSSGPVGVGHVALQFMEGAREKRVKSYLESEMQKRDALANFMQWGQQQRARLSQKGQEQFDQYAADVFRGKFAEETGHLKSDKGFAGFARKVFIGMTGGEMKGAPKVDTEKAMGAWFGMQQKDPSLTADYWRKQANDAFEKGKQESIRQTGRIDPRIVAGYTAGPLSDLNTQVGPEAVNALATIWQPQMQTAMEQFVSSAWDQAARPSQPAEGGVPTPREVPAPEPAPSPLGMVGVSVPGAPAQPTPRTQAEEQFAGAGAAPVPAPRPAGAPGMPASGMRQAMMFSALGIKPPEREILVDTMNPDTPPQVVERMGGQIFSLDGKQLTLGPGQITMPPGRYRPPTEGAGAGNVIVTGSETPGGPGQIFSGQKATGRTRPMLSPGQRPLYAPLPEAAREATSRAVADHYVRVQRDLSTAEAAADARAEQAKNAVRSRQFGAVLTMGILAPEAAQKLLGAIQSNSAIGVDSLLGEIDKARAAERQRNHYAYGDQIDQLNKLYKGIDSDIGQQYRDGRLPIGGEQPSVRGAGGAVPPAAPAVTAPVTAEQVKSFRKKQ